MDHDIEQMRADFERLANHRNAAGQWSRDDARDAGQQIKAAIASGDAQKIGQWASWLRESCLSLAAPGFLVPAMPMADLTPEPVERACLTCSGLTRPHILLRPGYCRRRTDLPPAYGEGHPLRQLPANQGASCDAWQVA